MQLDGELTIDQACAKYGVEKKALIGRCLRNDLDDPFVVDKISDTEFVLLDDWRLKKFVDQQKAAKAV